MAVFALLWFILGVVSTIWVFQDAADKRGTNIGCLWALVTFLFFPLGLIAYIIVRNAD